MNLLMISGDRSVLQGRKGAFWHTLEELSKHWERIDVITPSPPARSTRFPPPPAGEGGRGEREFFGNVFFHPCPHGLWYQPRWIVRMGRELIAAHQHDVMTVHEYPPFYNGLGALRLSRKTRVPAVLEIHHIVGYPVAGSFTEWIGRILSRVWLPFATKKFAAVRTVNGEVKRVLARWGCPEDRITVVPSFYLDSALLQLDRSITKDYDVVFCGRLESNKGLPELLRAIALLPKTRLLVIGDGSRRKYFEKDLANGLGITPRVRFAGWMATPQEVAAAIQSAHIFVMNSKSEGGPRVALEAMALGMPVVATRVGVMPEVIDDGKNGLFTNGTAADLKAIIERLLHDEPLCMQLGAEAQKILPRFERAGAVAGYANFLQTVASPSPS